MAMDNHMDTILAMETLIMPMDMVIITLQTIITVTMQFIPCQTNTTDIQSPRMAIMDHNTTDMDIMTMGTKHKDIKVMDMGIWNSMEWNTDTLQNSMHTVSTSPDTMANMGTIHMEVIWHNMGIIMLEDIMEDMDMERSTVAMLDMVILGMDIISILTKDMDTMDKMDMDITDIHIKDTMDPGIMCKNTVLLFMVRDTAMDILQPTLMDITIRPIDSGQRSKNNRRIRNSEQPIKAMHHPRHQLTMQFLQRLHVELISS